MAKNRASDDLAQQIDRLLQRGQAALSGGTLSRGDCHCHSGPRPGCVNILGQDHPDYATSLNNLAMLYRAMGDHAAALPLFRQALEIRRTALGENHPDYAASLNNLAVL